jgi:hypothetical protein
LTSKRLALLVDLILSRLGSALLIVLLTVLGLALTVGVFPRTFLGLLILIVVGGPICVIADALMRRGHPVGGLIGVIVLIALVWWWCACHPAFMHQNFF